MELVVKVAGGAALAAALEAGADVVAVGLPRDPGPEWWDRAAAWREESRQAGVRFFLAWERLIPERELAKAGELLAAAARLAPEALVLRDLGLVREARRRFPELALHGAGGLGLHNSPGLQAAKVLGLRRAVVAAPLSLKDLALMRRQTELLLEVALAPVCRGFPGLCRLGEEPRGCPCGAPGSGDLAGALEALGGLAQLGVEAVQVGEEVFQAEGLRRVVPLLKTVMKAPPEGRDRALAAAREVWAAFGRDRETGGILPDAAAPGKPPGRGREAPVPRLVVLDSGRSRIWLEARGHEEAAALARMWPGPLVVQLTRENYAAFLAEHRRWQPRRLAWRLPPVLRESALPFYRQALETLQQGGYRRFLAGDWGAVTLARAAGGEVYGDQTLGLINLKALEAARELGVARACLPAGAGQLARGAPAWSFWGYLYHFPTMAACPREGAESLPRRLPGESGFRWVVEGELAILCPEAAEILNDPELQRQAAPLVIALPRSGLPWGQVPAWSLPRRPRPPRGRP